MLPPPVVGQSLRGFLRPLRWHAGRPPLFLWRPRVQCRGVQSRKRPSHEEQRKSRNETLLTYVAAAGVAMIGLSYAAVPLYKLYCQATGLGGTAVSGHDSDLVESMEPVKERVVKVTFNADTHASMQWNFRPQQTEIFVVPGETALAFYRAKNPTDKPIVGISTYNVVPFEAGQYFNKIQAGPTHRSVSKLARGPEEFEGRVKYGLKVFFKNKESLRVEYLFYIDQKYWTNILLTLLFSISRLMKSMNSQKNVS
ncbi:cytochrome c oxidase assembly protein COX11, mitochondrial isoform X1 [Phycodurus eques]|uniref:cytochrome c oxidase assembly protein COX11, mitochondrial isoform X1 n=1 Tax=Phycodurus eques TaxID=693459 RepID=UPI002ACE0908|nr:cytochrome c oxidase assembly protein COX11, mitochondrial isoform X1 [Phycodurus eques]